VCGDLTFGNISLGGFHEKQVGFEGLPTLVENAKGPMESECMAQLFPKISLTTLVVLIGDLGL
jgi:hypothetical protein